MFNNIHLSKLAAIRWLRIIKAMVGEGLGCELGENTDVWGYTDATCGSDGRLRGGGLVFFLFGEGAAIS